MIKKILLILITLLLAVIIIKAASTDSEIKDINDEIDYEIKTELNNLNNDEINSNNEYKIDNDNINQREEKKKERDEKNITNNANNYLNSKPISKKGSVLDILKNKIIIFMIIILLVLIFFIIVIVSVVKYFKKRKKANFGTINPKKNKQKSNFLEDFKNKPITITNNTNNNNNNMQNINNNNMQNVQKDLNYWLQILEEFLKLEIKIITDEKTNQKTFYTIGFYMNHNEKGEETGFIFDIWDKNRVLSYKSKENHNFDDILYKIFEPNYNFDPNNNILIALAIVTRLNLIKIYNDDEIEEITKHKKIDKLMLSDDELNSIYDCCKKEKEDFDKFLAYTKITINFEDAKKENKKIIDEIIKKCSLSDDCTIKIENFENFFKNKIEKFHYAFSDSKIIKSNFFRYAMAIFHVIKCIKNIISNFNGQINGFNCALLTVLIELLKKLYGESDMCVNEPNNENI